MFEKLIILLILGTICVSIALLSAGIIQLFSMPVKIVFADLKISGTLFAAVIVIFALGIL